MKVWTAQLEELVTYAQNGMKAANHLLVQRVPSFLRMMRHAGVSPNTSPLLAEHLTANGATFCSLSVGPLLEPMLSVPATPLVCSLMSPSPRSSPTTNFSTFSQAVDVSPTPTPLEDFNVFDAIPLDTGQQTMTEVIDQFMEDLLTQEFCPVVLAEDS